MKIIKWFKKIWHDFWGEEPTMSHPPMTVPRMTAAEVLRNPPKFVDEFDYESWRQRHNK